MQTPLCYGVIHRDGKSLLVMEDVKQYSTQALGNIGREGQTLDQKQVMLYTVFGLTYEQDECIDVLVQIIATRTAKTMQKLAVKHNVLIRVVTEHKIEFFGTDQRKTLTAKDGNLYHWCVTNVQQQNKCELLKPYVIGKDLSDAYQDYALNKAFELVLVVDHRVPPDYGISKALAR